ncbi:hypothetical protein PGIGA_G00171250 [Pangasianodon gigas]|uniref:Uncharacterized protein n=1 Tax=Pangasianodon gigas TaxID=30993 RepID=A0ACC5XU22_PANGG|nr:hypothetical protein [Pangasianodon gigas]
MNSTVSVAFVIFRRCRGQTRGGSRSGVLETHLLSGQNGKPGQSARKAEWSDRRDGRLEFDLISISWCGILVGVLDLNTCSS